MAAKRENEQSLAEECAELKNKVSKLNEEKAEFISKMEEMVKEYKEKSVTSSLDGKQRKMSPCKGRETVYEMMEGWSFQGETEKMNFKVLRWMDKISNLNRLPPTHHQMTIPFSPKRFLEYLADGFMLCRLASALGEDQINANPAEKKECYEFFYKFAKEKAKLAEGCIFLEDELFGQTYEAYKSVFYTLYKLATQTKEKFNKKTMWEIEHEDNEDEIKKEGMRLPIGTSIGC